MERHAGVSLECRGVLAHHERRLNELIVYSSTQFPHVIRTMLAQASDCPKAIAGDRARCRRRFRDQEQLQSGGNRGHRAGAEARKAAALDRGSPRASDRIAACARAPLRADGPCRRTRAHPGARGDVMVDAGAYSVWPWTAAMEAGMSAGIMTGPYDIPVYHARAITVCHQQVAAGSLSRGRPQRRLLCDRNHGRRGGAGGRPRGCRRAHREHGAAVSDAVPLRHPQALRQRRLSANARARAAPPSMCRRCERGNSAARRTAA